MEQHGIVNVLEEIAARCGDANLKPRAYVDEAAGLLRALVRRKYCYMARIDQQLVSKGGLKSAGIRDVSGKIAAMEQFIDGQLKATKLSAMSAWRHKNRRWSDPTKWMMGIAATLIGSILLLAFKDWWWPWFMPPP